MKNAIKKKQYVLEYKDYNYDDNDNLIENGEWYRQGCEPNSEFDKSLKQDGFQYTINNDWEMIFDSKLAANKLKKTLEAESDYEFRVVPLI